MTSMIARFVQSTELLLWTSASKAPVLLERMMDLVRYILDKMVVLVDEDESQEANEAFTILLKTWSTIRILLSCLLRCVVASIGEAEPTEFVVSLRNYLRNAMPQLFRVYMHAKLKMTSKVDEFQHEEVEATAKDRDDCEDELVSIALVARMQPQQPLLDLHQALTQLSGRFTTIDQGLHVPQEEFIQLCEQVHWLLLMTSHVLADAGESEKPLISESLLDLSNTQEDWRMDPIVQLAQTVFRWLDLSCTLTHLDWSPLVVETLFWSIERITKTFLLLDKRDYYQPIGEGIVNAFTKEQGESLVKFFVERSHALVLAWNAEVDVLEQIVRCMSTFAKSREIRETLTRLEAFSDLVTFLLMHIGQYPEAIHGKMMAMIVSAISYSNSLDKKRHYFGLVSNVVAVYFGEWSDMGRRATLHSLSRSTFIACTKNQRPLLKSTTCWMHAFG
jgi:hypothetical protein